MSSALFNAIRKLERDSAPSAYLSHVFYQNSIGRNRKLYIYQEVCWKDKTVL